MRARIFRYSLYYELGVAPNGQVVAALVPADDGRRVLVAMEVNTPKTWGVAKVEDLDITHFVWINDKRLLLRVEDLKRGSGEGGSGLAAVNVDGSHLDLFPGNAVFMATYQDGSDDVLAYYEKRDHSLELFRLNTTKASSHSLAPGMPPRALRFLLDHQVRVRIVETLSEDAKRTTIHYRADWAFDSEVQFLSSLTPSSRRVGAIGV